MIFVFGILTMFLSFSLDQAQAQVQQELRLPTDTRSQLLAQQQGGSAFGSILLTYKTFMNRSRQNEAGHSKNVHSGAKYLMQLAQYLEKVCINNQGPELTPYKDKACILPQLYNRFNSTSFQIDQFTDEDWDSPPMWNEETLRSGYWNISPFAEIDDNDPDRQFRMLIQWLVLKQALVKALPVAKEVMQKHFPKRALDYRNKIFPSIQSYLEGQSMLEQQLGFVRDMQCLTEQNVCTAARISRLRELMAIIDTFAPQYQFFKERLKSLSSELSTDSMDQLAQLDQMESIFQDLKKSDLLYLMGLLEQLSAGHLDSELLSQYTQALKGETSRWKNLSDQKKIELWSSIISLNNWLSAAQELRKLSESLGDTSNIPQVDTGLDPQKAYEDNIIFLLPLQRFLQEEGLDIEKIPLIPMPDLPKVPRSNEVESQEGVS